MNQLKWNKNIWDLFFLDFVISESTYIDNVELDNATRTQSYWNSVLLGLEFWQDKFLQ